MNQISRAIITLHQYKVQNYLVRKLLPDHIYAFVSKKRTYHQGVAIVAAKRIAGDIKLYIAEYDSPSDGVNAHGNLRWCCLIEVADNSVAAHEEAILKALKEYVKQNRTINTQGFNVEKR